MFGWDCHAAEVVRGAGASFVCSFLNLWPQDRGGNLFSRIAVNSASGRQHCGEFESITLA